LGTSLAAGLFNATTGPADLIVGAPGYDAPSTSASLLDVGAVYVIFGSPQLSRTIELSKTKADYKVTGTFNGGMLGAKVAVGDLNGDGYADLAASAPAANANGLKLSGAVFLVLGGPNVGGEKNTSQASARALFGNKESDRFGSSLAMATSTVTARQTWLWVRPARAARGIRARGRAASTCSSAAQTCKTIRST
jgi:hypothetical protein